jgi:hypothetical protein
MPPSIGELACGCAPGGVSIDLPYNAVDERVAVTRNELDGDAPVIYEASFLEDNVFVAVDTLVRTSSRSEVMRGESATASHVSGSALIRHPSEGED